MLKKNSGQIDIFNHMIYERLIPKNHLLVKIDSILDFSFIYEKLEDRYSNTGRGSKDPIMMTKLLLLEYIYNLSDVEVRERIFTDIAFRWFLGLGLDDEVPDDTTISHFRIK
ncbi:MAG TPA: transposase, partial [Patescibacteria group bacterium]|nr:transposase [Patescibacteria group bacterium]